ncbi:MAG: cardiolipin synthase [Paludibacteraceae bacterium]|nr:cardiolipin synthase [Paludibacteraceae bacterium]
MNKIVWIVLILAGVALLFWLVFGINWRSKQNYDRKHHLLRSRMQAENTEELRRLLFSNGLTMRVEQRFQPLTMLLARGGRPSVSLSTPQIITSGKDKYNMLMSDLICAKESIHMEYFHFGIDKSSRKIRQVLMEKARQGVKVRFINENIANRPIPNLYFRSMRKAGVEVVNFSDSRFSLLRFLMTLSYRDHRKIVVIDNRIGYTGGMNINDHYFYQWRDTHLRLTGEAVASLQYAFLDTWLASGGQLHSAVNSFFFHLDKPSCGQSLGTLTQITPDDPTSPEPVLLTAYEWILNHAQKYVWFQSPYIAPPPSLISAMRNAAQRGVDVRVMVPEHCDTAIMRPINKSYYAELTEAGVQFYVRSGEFMHSKTIVCDDYLSCVGSANLDYRSFGIDYEINTFFYDRAVALRQKQIFENDLPICRLVIAAEAHPTPWQRLMRHLAPIV